MHFVTDAEECGGKVISMFVVPLGASRLVHQWHLFCLSSLVPFLESTKIQSQCCGCSCHSLLLFTRTAQTNSATHISFEDSTTRIFLVSSLFSQISPSKPSLTALLPLFVKTEIMREQHVSSYCTALCLSKKTQAAPWQLTTHSQLSNATEPPKRPLFNVTRWHCVMQAKQSDMICSDSLLKWKHCTYDGHCCTENWGRVCRELARKWSPPWFCAAGCNHQELLGWNFITSFISWFILPHKITNVPPRQALKMLCHSY